MYQRLSDSIIRDHQVNVVSRSIMIEIIVAIGVLNSNNCHDNNTNNNKTKPEIEYKCMQTKARYRS